MTKLKEEKASKKGKVETEERKSKRHFNNPKINIIKKNGTRQPFDGNKIRAAIEKSAERVMVDLTEEAKDDVVNIVIDLLKNQTSDAEVSQIHNCVEAALEKVNPLVAKSYREYRNYKNDFVHIWHIENFYPFDRNIKAVKNRESVLQIGGWIVLQQSLLF